MTFNRIDANIVFKNDGIDFKKYSTDVEATGHACILVLRGVGARTAGRSSADSEGSTFLGIPLLAPLITFSRSERPRRWRRLVVWSNDVGSPRRARFCLYVKLLRLLCRDRSNPLTPRYRSGRSSQGQWLGNRPAAMRVLMLHLRYLQSMSSDYLEKENRNRNRDQGINFHRMQILMKHGNLNGETRRDMKRRWENEFLKEMQVMNRNDYDASRKILNPPRCSEIGSRVDELVLLFAIWLTRGFAPRAIWVLTGTLFCKWEPSSILVQLPWWGARRSSEERQNWAQMP